MTYLEIIINNCIFLLFPLAAYLLYITYKKNLNDEEGKVTLEIAIISSLYFVLRYGMAFSDCCPTMLFDIPLLICYFKKRNNFAIVVSLILVFYQYFFLQINIILLLMEYVTYFIVFTFLYNKIMSPIKIINIFVVIKSFVLSLEVFWFINPTGSYQANLIYLLFLIFVFYVISNLVLYFLDQCEKIIRLNNSLCDIEQEKQLRSSLFKVTHEIKNPIAVCKGYLDMIDLNNEKKVHQYIPIIKDEIERTLTLMDDFLDYTKIKIQKEELDLYMLFEELEGSLKPLFQKNNIKVDFKIPEEECYIVGDYNRLKQVFINLLKNAIEAKDANKNCSKVQVSLKELPTMVEITIKDNGVGMDENTLNHICEMFFTTKKKGSGLGLSLSREIITLHNGTLNFYSKEGIETVVKITLPKK